MLADMFATLSLPKLLSVTRESSMEVAEQSNPDSAESKALAAVWEGPEDAKKAQVCTFKRDHTDHITDACAKLSPCK